MELGESSADGPPSPVFRPTHWSVVLQAQAEQTGAGTEALQRLCQTYWFPLYAFVRRKGYPAEEAKDLTQAFFAALLDRKALTTVGPEKGRFRTFLLTSLSHFLSDEWDKARRIKRGGGQVPVYLDAQDPEERYRLEPTDRLTPERAFDRSWAQMIMATVLARLRQECDGANKIQRFDVLKNFLLGTGGFEKYAEIAAHLGVSEQAIKGAIHRLRQRFAQILREEIAQTLTHPGDVEEELRSLFSALQQ